MSKRQEIIKELKKCKMLLVLTKYNRQLSNEVEQKIPQFKKNNSKQKILTLYR